MAQHFVNLFLDAEQEQKLKDVGLEGEIFETEGKKAVKVPVGDKEYRKLIKGFTDLEFDDNNACVLPDDAQKTLFDMILTSESLDCMKVAIVKLYNPLAGKELRSKTF